MSFHLFYIAHPPRYIFLPVVPGLLPIHHAPVEDRQGAVVVVVIVIKIPVHLIIQYFSAKLLE